MHVVSVSRRTDIPAFYSPWFMNRVRAGFALVSNPFNSRQISTVDLSPENVACFVFMTKDPRPLMEHLPELDRSGYRYFFQITVTGLPSVFEPKVPDAATIVAAMRKLHSVLGPDRIIWRFDPIIVSDLTPPETIAATFARLADQLEGTVSRVITSFADEYRHLKRRIASLHSNGQSVVCNFLQPAEFSSLGATIATSLADAAKTRGMSLYSCAEEIDPSTGVNKGSCIDSDYIRKLFGIALSPSKDSGQRAQCRCIKSRDIGVYGTCHHGCIYCYARADRSVRGKRKHDPQSPFLLNPAGLSLQQ